MKAYILEFQFLIGMVLAFNGHYQAIVSDSANNVSIPYRYGTCKKIKK